MSYKTFSGRKASQMKGEIEGFIKLLKSNGVTSYIEIGARDGDTFHAVMTSLPAGSRGIALDLPGALWGKSTTGDNLKRCIADLRAKGYDVDYILGDSTNEQIIAEAAALAPFDAAMIDGDHTYDGVKADWLNYKGMAKIVGFHDIVGNGQREKVHKRPVEVPKLWEEIKASGAKTVEFVDAESLMGIGVCLQ